MSKTQYLPADWLDEVSPDPADSPNDFVHCVDGRWVLWPTDEDQEERNTWSLDVAKGDVVEFAEYVDYGHWNLTILEERNQFGHPVVIGDATIPPEANSFYCDDIDEDVFETVSSLVDALCQNDPDMSGEIRVWAYNWTTGHNWAFSVIDGKGSFTKVELSS